MRKSTAALAIALTTSLCVPVCAQQLTNEKSTIDYFTADNVSGLLKELGAQQVQVQSSDTGKSVTFQDGAIPYNAILTVCNKTTGANCEATILVVIFEGSTSYPVDAFNNFNKEQSFVTAVKLEENKYAISRMLLSSGGVTKKNVAVNIASFASAPAKVMQYLSSQLVAGYQDGQGANLQRVSYNPAPSHAIQATPRDIAQILKAVEHSTPTAALRH
ncbi:MAG: YbjN domain-containing protein [Micropepsaceae bacterium]